MWRPLLFNKEPHPGNRFRSKDLECFRHLSQNRCCGGGRVWGVGDGAADDQVAGALVQGFGGTG